MEILREFYDASKTDLVFSRSGNITPKFYRILREACERAGVPYGRGTRDGLVLHDARHTATTHLLESNVSPKTRSGVDGLVRQGLRSLLLTRNQTIKGTSRAVAGEACGSDDGVNESPRNKNAQPVRSSATISEI